MRTASDTAIGVDVGGTRIRVGRISPDGELLDRVIEPVRTDRAGFVAQLMRLIAAMRDDSSVAVGVGIPGRVDGATQQIKSVGYLDLAGLDLPEMIRREAGLPARIENDAAMALIAEAKARRGDPAGVIAMFTIGTGIGGAILQGGLPWYGGGVSGQLGHMVVAATGPICNCGRVGCVETFSSGTALGGLIAAAGLPGDLRAQDLLARAAAGEAMSADLLAAWAAPLRRAIETLVAVIDPQLVVIGGGLGAEMVQALQRSPAQGKWFAQPVQAAILGDDAGVIGAGLCGFGLGGAYAMGQAG